MAKKLTRKQAKFTDEYIKTGNGSKSAMVAYETDSPDSAKTIAHKNLNNNKIQTVIAQALAKKKITEDTIAQKIADGLEAKKVAFNFDTKSFEQLDYPDYAIQHKFLNSLIEILGVKAPEKHQHTLSGVVGIDTLDKIRDRLGVG